MHGYRRNNCGPRGPRWTSLNLSCTSVTEGFMLWLLYMIKHKHLWEGFVPPWSQLALTSTVCDLCWVCFAGRLKLESNNESSPLCLEPMEQTRGVSTALCEFQSVGGVIVSNYPFIVHVASQQESAALRQPPPHPLSLPTLIHIMLVCVGSVGPNQITVCAPCVGVLMKTMLGFNLNWRIFSAAFRMRGLFWVVVFKLLNWPF